MKCPVCGYVMSDLDATCPRCARLKLSSPAAPPAPPASPDGEPATSALSPRARLAGPKRRTALLAIGIVGILLIIVWSVVADRRTAHVMDSLRRQYSGRHFAEIRGWRKVIPFGADLTSLRVDDLYLETLGADVFRATVVFSSRASVPIAPYINVSLFDKRGVQLVRGAVVDHYAADLNPGSTHTTTDSLRVPPGAAPAFVAVDDGRPR